MVELTIDGSQVEVPEGSMVMHAAHKLGVYVPHFCYHKKLSIAANCRMCLVEVEKAPKALPACATPVTNGMIVHTRSERAVAAQKSVMEFLLINHPLDCPICDQGGECQLQDLAVGYGGSASRYTEEKRVVFHKNLGPLVSAQEMSRCIHCTRCVRFGEEIGGVMEMGMIHRGEHSEITTFVGRAIESELSGNMIDICPVGALTSKPFRYQARTWELARRRSVSPHDSVGANLVVQVKADRVLRVVPFENDAVNECWISDRDRFSYEALNSADRLVSPMVRACDGNWHAVGWPEALQAVADGLTKVKDSFGAGQIGALASAISTTEEFSLLARLMRALGSDNIDFRLRQTDPALDAALAGSMPWLGMPVDEIGELDRVLVVGSFLRADQPLITQRLRQAAKHGTKVYLVDLAADDPLLRVAGRATVAPSALADTLARIASAVATARGLTMPESLLNVTPDASAQHIAAGLVGGERTALWLGSAALEVANAAQVLQQARLLAELLGIEVGFLPVGGNAVGGHLAGAVPQGDGRNAAAMLAAGLKSYIVLHAEPTLDAADGAAALAALKGAQFNVALTAFQSAAADWAHVMLPISPFTETSGTFVNLGGVAQSFKGASRPVGQSRPGWKVLRVLGNTLQLPAFDEDSSEAVRDAALGNVQARLNNTIHTVAAATAAAPVQGLERVGDVPIYSTDVLVRRSEPLQATPAARAPRAGLSAGTLANLGLADGQRVRVSNADGTVVVELEAKLEAGMADGVVRVASGRPETAALGTAFGSLSVERV